MAKIGKLTILLFILLSVCVISRPAKAETSVYVFSPDQSIVVKTGGFAGVNITFAVAGQYWLRVDPNAGVASFGKVDANLADETGAEYGRSLDEIFNMTGLAGTITGDSTIEFEGKTADGTESDVRLKLSLNDDSAQITGNTTPPPNSADMFIYDFEAVATRKYAGGTGEPDNPYQIATASDLISLGATPEDYGNRFILTADIDLSEMSFDRAVIAPDVNDIESFFQGSSFFGTFDGQGYFIRCLHIQGQDHVGLFGRIGGAVIINLGLEAVDIHGNNYVGGLIGENPSFGHVSYCHVNGVVNGNYITGGLVGRNRGNIYNCSSSGTVNGGERVGGLVGNNDNNICNSYSTCSVNGSGAVGGLVGDCDSSSITNCYSTGQIAGDNDLGGLVGYSRASNIYQCFWDIETSGLSSSAGGEGLVTAKMQDIKTYLDAGWDFAGELINGTCDFWQSDSNDYPVFNMPAVPEGSGTKESPYIISNAQDLGTVWFRPLSSYKLDADINLVDISWNTSVIPGFRGTFDGNHFSIRSLRIQGTGYLGLFCNIGFNAEVWNLGLEDIFIEGSGNYGVVEYIGGLAGINSGTVSNCYSTGIVNGGNRVGSLIGYNIGDVNNCHSTCTTNGFSYVGGLVGYNLRSITHCHSAGLVEGINNIGGLVGFNSRDISFCSSSVTVNGEDHVGGLVGYNDNPGPTNVPFSQISSCYSTGMVSGNSKTGGLVGGNYDKISHCYSTGTVDGSSEVGGLAGFNSGDISASYSCGLVNGNNTTGGLVGSTYAQGAVTNCAWDTDSSGLLYSEGGIGLTTSQMMDSHWIGLQWGDDPNWIQDSGNDYPRLAWEGTDGEPIIKSTIYWMDGHGTAEDPWQIHDSNQFIGVSKAPVLWGDHFILINDLDLIQHVWSQAVIPVFSGLFDGQNNLIQNLNIQVMEKTTMNPIGLFGRSDGKILNLGLTDVNFAGAGKYDHIGALAGINEGDIANCYSTGEVVGFDECSRGTVGGLVGLNYGAITDCYNNNSVTGECGFFVYKNGIGGLIGINEGSITRCFNNGTVSCDGIVGGLVGYNRENGTITHCYNTGIVSGLTEVGGLVGYSEKNTITYCHNHGIISGLSEVGGLVGYNVRVSLINCYNTGTVSGRLNNIGGLVGRNQAECLIANSYNSGNISGNDEIGGLVGENDFYSRISNCYNIGEISGDENIGGLVGENKNSSISNSYNAGKISGDDKIGGLVGKGSADRVTACFWDTRTSELSTSAGGSGIDTTEMQTADTYIDAGWDFMDETANGTENIWWILEGRDYPRLWWESILVDDFEDSESLPLWQVYEPDAEKIRVEETNGRLEILANDTADDIVAGYISNGWRLDVTSDFALRVDFHFSKVAAGDSWVMLLLLPSLNEPVARFTVLEAGCLNNQTFYLHEIEENGSIIQGTSVSRSTDDGTLYISYDAEQDELYMSYSSYGKSNAWQTVEGLLQNRWAAQPVYVVIGGGSDRVVLDTGDAYLDNFAVDSGLLDFSAALDDTGAEEP